MMRRFPLAVAALAAVTARLASAQPTTPVVPGTGAKVDRAAFACQRLVPGGPGGPASMRLDAAALAHSRLADIRIVTRDGYQVPYLIEPAEEPLVFTLSPLQAVDGRELVDGLTQRQGSARSVYAFPLPEAGLPPARVILETAARVFDRTVNIVARFQDRRGREADRWQTVVSDSWRHADPDTPAPLLALELPALDTTLVRLVIDEGDNRPLAIDRATLEVPTWRLRFFREAQDDLWLMYGNAAVGPPRYDLALLGPRLAEGAATEVTAAPEQATGRNDGTGLPRAVFWGVLLAAIAALLLLVWRLLKAPPPAA